MMWRRIPGYTGYEVSENGAVRRYNDHEELSGSISAQGYQRYHLTSDKTGKTVQVNAHAAVMAAFYGPTPAEGLIIVHLNGDKLDNRLGNLWWQTGDTAIARLASARWQTAQRRAA